MIRVI